MGILDGFKRFVHAVSSSNYITTAYNGLINYVVAIRRVDSHDSPVNYEEELLNSTHSYCKLDPYLKNGFILLSILLFVFVVFKYIWNYRRKQNKDSPETTIQVEEPKDCKKEDCEKLKEIYKILLLMRSQIVDVPDSRIPRPCSASASKYNKKQTLPLRSLYSNVSRKQNVEGSLSNEDMKESLQMALLLLKEQIGEKLPIAEGICAVAAAMTDSNAPENSPENNALQMSTKPFKFSSEAAQKALEHWKKRSESEEVFFPLSNETKGKRILSHRAMKQHVEDVGKECSKTKQALLYLQNQMDSNPMMRNGMDAESRSVTLCRKCSEEREEGNSASSLNTCNLHLSAGEKPIYSCELPEQIKRPVKGKDVINYSTKKNALHIEILFNRNVKLAE